MKLKIKKKGWIDLYPWLANVKYTLQQICVTFLIKENVVHGESQIPISVANYSLVFCGLNIHVKTCKIIGIQVTFKTSSPIYFNKTWNKVKVNRWINKPLNKTRYLFYWIY